MPSPKKLTAVEIVGPIFQNAHQPTLIKDRTSRFLHVNKAASLLLGVVEGSLVGKSDYDLLPFDEAEKIVAMDRNVFGTGQERLFEEQISGPDGRPRFLMTHKHRVDLPGGEPVLVASFSDVTDLRQAEQSLRRSQERHRSLIELHPQVPWVADPVGSMIEVGPLWQKICGRSTEDALGFGWLVAVHPGDLPRMLRSWKRSLTSGQPFDMEARFQTTDGSYRWFRGRAAAKRDASGKIDAWYGLLEDAHDRRLAIDALRRSQDELRRHRDELEEAVRQRTVEVERKSQELDRLLQQEREVNALQRRFVSMISHEFRTPLTIIDAAAQRLSRSHAELTPDRVGEKTRQIKSAVNRMVELMESILAAGRLQTGKIAISKQPCSLLLLLEDCIARRAELSPHHLFKGDLSLLPDTIVADKDALERVFINLLSNAVKYSSGKPEIRVIGRVEGDWIKISVADNGIGMDAEDLPKLFQPYFRARSSVGIAGTGIGLNIAKEIVELHDGSISVESELGSGTTFTVALPIGAVERSIDTAA
jgi:PAS domain S-box-containing protein